LEKSLRLIRETLEQVQLLIESLYNNGSFKKKAYAELLKADNRAIKHLTHELIANPDPNIRETCAEILRDRGHARAVPALIEALNDRELIVRQDALWAIGPLCGLKPTSLETLLRITNIDPPNKLYRRVNMWWKENERYIKNNYGLW
jgi:HEAT repeat protein